MRHVLEPWGTFTQAKLMNCKQCGKCGAKWIDGQLFWSTGKPGRDEDLAGLVCDRWGGDQCINPVRGTEHGGDTWAKRSDSLPDFKGSTNP